MFRRRNPGYGPGYGGYGYGPPPRYRSGNSCLRDACLLETGCCVAESLDGNCLLASLLILPQFAAATLAPLRPTGRRVGGRGPASRAARRERPDRRPAAEAMTAAIGVYQREISANRRPCCRFSPSCSHYAVEAIERHGALRGGLLAARRLLRCRPGGARGADPVPG